MRQQDGSGANCPEHHDHPDHRPELARINRLIGQLEGVKRMIEAQRYCPDIMTQLRAVQSAAHSVESNMLERHLQACVINAMRSNNADEAAQKIEELSALFRKRG